MINNGIEAIPEGGSVVVDLTRKGNEVLIAVIDDGGGIPDEIMARLGERGLTTKVEGKGLGFFSAQKVFESLGGRIEVITRKNAQKTGTSVNIYLPAAEIPSWFVQKLDLIQKDTVVILDDDPSIHDLWERRLGNGKNSLNLKLIHLHSVDDISKWYKKSTARRKNAVYLCDYDLKDRAGTGLDAIKQFNIEKQSILVTSYYYKTDLQKMCSDLGVKILPKELIESVPLFAAN